MDDSKEIKERSGWSNEGEEDEEEEDEEEDEEENSEDEELLNRLRFKRKPKTIDVKFEYFGASSKLELEEPKKDKQKDRFKRKVIIWR